MSKGTITPELAAILRNKDARNRLRKAIEAGEDLIIRIGDTTYRVSTTGHSGSIEDDIKAEPIPRQQSLVAS